jgi:FkbM family methyltransferase
MGVPQFVLGDREALESAARAATQSVRLGDGDLMCRVLSKYLMFVDPHDVGVTPRLCLDGFWESWITTAIARVVQPGFFCVDVGANHGYYTLLFADAVGPEGRVLAVEPNPALAKLVTLSVEVNGFDGRTQVVQKAATDGATRTVRLTVPARRGACATICLPGSITGDLVDVEAASVDDLTATWPRVDVVKIDAEGAEDQIWRGMTRTLSRNAAVVVVLEFVASRYANPAAFLRDVRAAGFGLRVIGHDSRIEPVFESTLLTAGGVEGWTLFLQRE